MQSDTIKLLATYVVALVVIIGGGLMLYALRVEPGSDDLQLALVGFIGGALSWVFGRETATAATRAAQSSAAAGADAVRGNG